MTIEGPEGDRESRGDRWLAKGRWAFVWRVGGQFAALLTVFWLIGAGFVYLGWVNPPWTWMISYPYAITFSAFLERVGVSAIAGLLFGWSMSYQKRPRRGSTPAA